MGVAGHNRLLRKTLFGRSSILWIFLLFAALITTAAPTRELVFLTWSQYIDPAVIRQFESENQVNVRQVHFETDSVRDELLADARRQRNNIYAQLLKGLPRL